MYCLGFLEKSLNFKEKEYAKYLENTSESAPESFSSEEVPKGYNFSNPKKLLQILLSELIAYDEIIDIARILANTIEEKHTNMQGKKFANVSQCIFECYKRICGFKSSKWASVDGLKYEVKRDERPIAFERQIASGEYVPYKIFNEDQLIVTKNLPESLKPSGVAVKKVNAENIDPLISNIVHLVKSGENLFITGHAGTGKSYILNMLKSKFKKLVVTSTTGIAAVNVKGQTIHSWAGVGICRYPVDTVVKNILNKPTVRNQILKCEMLALDEISMLNIKTFEYIDKVLRLVRDEDTPFGGIQVIFFGDFFQLPPVEKETEELHYCFESPIWKELNLKNIMLTENHRQNEENFIQALSNMRINSLTREDEELLNSRDTVKSVVRGVIKSTDKKEADILHIFSTNEEADNYNQMMFNRLNSPVVEFLAQDEVLRGKDFVSENLTEREETILEIFNKNCRAEKLIKLKLGAKVMLLINSDFKTGLINGSCGTIIAINEDSITVEFENGAIKEIEPEKFEYYYNDKVMAQRHQYPLRLAWAITIHKSQGMTLENLYVDCKRIFERGQAYVAMSRVKTLSGLYLENFSKERVLADEKVVEFYKNLNTEKMDKIIPGAEIITYEPNADNKAAQAKGDIQKEGKEALIDAADKVAQVLDAIDAWVKISDVAEIMGVKRYDRLVEGEKSSTIAHLINRFLKKRGYKTVTIKRYMSSIIWAAAPNVKEEDMPEELKSAIEARN